MSKRFINGTDFNRMAAASAAFLQEKANEVNALNVFPVPDGDTGTNMNLTLNSGAEELNKKPSDRLGLAAEVFSKGLLMGARGNSGVILSQLFRGFAKSLSQHDDANVQQFAAALQQGVDTAYQAVVKPVEGTILTVAREAAKHAVTHARRFEDILELMVEVHSHAKDALAKTPELLPVLKQVGVVDAGGQGLVFIYEGFIEALREDGERLDTAVVTDVGAEEDAAESLIPVMDLAHEAHKTMAPRSAQSHLATEDIEFGYCTEFLLHLKPGKVPGMDFTEPQFREELQQHGDSLLVVADDDLVKVHIHAEYPGSVMNLAMNYGDLSRIKIDNMRDQHTRILEQETSSADAENAPDGDNADESPIVPEKDYGMVAVAIGEGISEIFSSLGVDVILSGGQTMNPSTEDIVSAVEQVSAKKVFVFPNNSNIILAAEQAKEISEKEIAVIPTKSIPQGMASILAFQEQAELETNKEAMIRAAGQVRSGQVTFAVRSSTIDEMEIKEGDFLGILDNKIVTTSPDLMDTCKSLLEQMIDSGEEVVTIYSGEDAADEHVSELESFLDERYPDAEVEMHYGGQPLYYFIFSVE